MAGECDIIKEEKCAVIYNKEKGNDEKVFNAIGKNDKKRFGETAKKFLFL